jgi:hypothetical protein
METEYVSCEVRTGFIYIIQMNVRLQGVKEEAAVASLIV